jgi:hypothetical protein
MVESKSVEVVREVECVKPERNIVECVAGYVTDIRTCEVISRWRSVTSWYPLGIQQNCRNVGRGRKTGLGNALSTTARF